MSSNNYLELDEKSDVDSEHNSPDANLIELQGSDRVCSPKNTEVCDEDADAHDADKGGVLTSDTVAAALSNLGHNPDSLLVYTKLSLQSLGLVDISIIGLKFLYIQTLILDRNNLTSLKALRPLKHLIILSACHNELTSEGVFSELSGTEVTKTVTKLSLHHNNIIDLTGLQQFQYCREIDLSDNIISGSITHSQLSNLPSLTILNLANNMIEEVDDWAFENSGVKDITISGNRLTTANFLTMLVPTLRSVNLSNNNLISFSSLSMLHNAAFIDLSYNKVSDLAEVGHLANCSLLRSLTLTGNPAFTGIDTVDSDYRSHVSKVSETYGNTIAIAELVASGVHLQNPDGEDDDIVAADEVEQYLLNTRRNTPGNKTTENKFTYHYFDERAPSEGMGTYRKHSPVMGEGVVIGSPFIEGVNELNRIGQLSCYSATLKGSTDQRPERQLMSSLATSYRSSLISPHPRQDPNYCVLKEKKAAEEGNNKNTIDAEITHPVLCYRKTPDEEDKDELCNLPPSQQIRIKVLWRLPCLTTLDGEPVTPEEMTLSQCIIGGHDRKHRLETWTEAFGRIDNDNCSSTYPCSKGAPVYKGGCAGGSGLSAAHSLRFQRNVCF